LYLDKERWMPVSSAHTGSAALAGDLANSLQAVLGTLPAQRSYHTRQLARLVTQLLRAARGQSTLAIPQRDSRFDHPAWQSNPLLQRILQMWLGSTVQYQQWLSGLDIAETDRARLIQLGEMLSATLAPSNTPFNPRILERVKATRGASLCQGAQNLAADIVLRQPLAPLCPDDAFLVGRDLAHTPGQVILREPLFELIQYRPTTVQLHASPLLIIPPPLNRFYLLDLTERTSLVKHALDQGLHVFLISWRNPDASHCGSGFNHYVRACDHALKIVSQVTNHAPVSLLGVCAGGLLTLLLQGVLTSRRQGDRVCAASYMVTPIDARLSTGLVRLLGPAARQRLRLKVWQRGFLPAEDMARAFAWQRPEQFVWPQALDRYALGHTPMPREIMSWSQDSTRLPAHLVDDLLDYFERDPFACPGSLVLQGCSIDLRAITTPSWHLGAQHDHIVPCHNSFPGQRLGGDSTFVQSHSGHIQSLINPPDHPGAWFRAGKVAHDDMPEWLNKYSPQSGSWRHHWTAWLKLHSGKIVAAPKVLGSAAFPPLQPAPGRYVHQS
jgi:polyhydroxyalkanoate synthase